MNDLRQELHRLVDSLADQSLEHAKAALLYCANPEQHRMNIEKAKRHIVETARQRLEQYAERTGQGFLSGIGSGGGMTHVDGSHHSSMIAFEDGKEVTVHIYVYRGTQFEIVETVETSADGQRLIRRERIKGSDGSEQVLTAEIPVLRGDS
jgi:hypothetical protein